MNTKQESYKIECQEGHGKQELCGLVGLGGFGVKTHAKLKCGCFLAASYMKKDDRDFVNSFKPVNK